MNQLEPWLSRYAWYRKLPENWKRIVHAVISETGAESFVGMTELHDAMANMDGETVLDFLTARGDVRRDVVGFVEKLMEA